MALGPVGVTELAERVDLPKSTVARLLAALEAESAVEQIETGAFAGSTGPINITELTRTRRIVMVVSIGPVSRFGSPRRSLV